MSLARAAGRGEKASMFHETRESLGAETALTLDGVRGGDGGEDGERVDGEREGPAWYCVFLEGMGPQRRVEWLKAERVRQSLSAVMVVCWKAGKSGLAGLDGLYGWM